MAFDEVSLSPSLLSAVWSFVVSELLLSCNSREGGGDVANGGRGKERGYRWASQKMDGKRGSRGKGWGWGNM